MKKVLWKTILVLYNLLAPMLVGIFAVAWIGILLGIFVKTFFYVIDCNQGE